MSRSSLALSGESQKWEVLGPQVLSEYGFSPSDGPRASRAARASLAFRLFSLRQMYRMREVL